MKIKKVYLWSAVLPRCSLTYLLEFFLYPGFIHLLTYRSSFYGLPIRGALFEDTRGGRSYPVLGGRGGGRGFKGGRESHGLPERHLGLWGIPILSRWQVAQVKQG